MVARVKGRFQNDVAIYHSALNNQQKYEQYCRVFEKQASIVVGTRSAVFMPFDHLGLIILDEGTIPAISRIPCRSTIAAISPFTARVISVAR